MRVEPSRRRDYRGQGRPTDRRARVEEPACKPDSVPRSPANRRAGWRPSLWEPRRRDPRAAYPGASGGPPAPCSALLRVGFAQPTSHPAAGELLPHRFTLAPVRDRRYRARSDRWAVCLCGTFRGSPRLGVAQHPALWSPDFPRQIHRRGRPTDSSAIKYRRRTSPSPSRTVRGWARPGYSPCRPRPTTHRLRDWPADLPRGSAPEGRARSGPQRTATGTGGPPRAVGSA